MLKSFPTTLWLIGASVAVAALTPVVGQSVTNSSAVPLSEVLRTATPPTNTAAPPTKSSSSRPATKNEEGRVTPMVQSAKTRLGLTAVNEKGLTLYISTLDATSPPRSVCVSPLCLKAWKPVYLGEHGEKPLTGAGIKANLLGRASRGDGKWQATLGGSPLYAFALDKNPGDVKGQGLKGIWYAISPNGKHY